MRKMLLPLLAVIATISLLTLPKKAVAQADANPPGKMHMQGLNGFGVTNLTASNAFNTATGPLPTGILTAGTTNGQSGMGGHLLQVVGGQRWNTFDAGSLTNVYGYYYSNSTAAGTALSVSNCWAGKVLLSSGQKTYRITNALVGTTSAVLATINTDGVGSSMSNCTPTSGLITINLSANVGANTAISWWLIQQ